MFLASGSVERFWDFVDVSLKVVRPSQNALRIAVHIAEYFSKTREAFGMRKTGGAFYKYVDSKLRSREEVRVLKSGGEDWSG